uniref:Unkown protein n=1 Tax=Riptortus pedestris TaxID=329032 RepID=R4WR63_RIPPE|nr:unkown protein [Riptortus pedestris]
MHRATNPSCSCATSQVADTCIMATSDSSSEDCPLNIGQPYITKPSTIRANRGHRSWMTHLPLSRPRELLLTAI